MRAPPGVPTGAPGAGRCRRRRRRHSDRRHPVDAPVGTARAPIMGARGKSPGGAPVGTPGGALIGTPGGPFAPAPGGVPEPCLGHCGGCHLRPRAWGGAPSSLPVRLVPPPRPGGRRHQGGRMIAPYSPAPAPGGRPKTGWFRHTAGPSPPRPGGRLQLSRVELREEALALAPGGTPEDEDLPDAMARPRPALGAALTHAAACRCACHKPARAAKWAQAHASARGTARALLYAAPGSSTASPSPPSRCPGACFLSAR
jgi:hypothetical protein